MAKDKSKPSNISTGVMSLFKFIIVVAVLLALVAMAPILFAGSVFAAKIIAVGLVIWLAVWLLGAGVNAIKRN